VSTARTPEDVWTRRYGRSASSTAASGTNPGPLAAVDEADRPYLRVQTSSGVRAVDTSASGIPDIGIYHFYGPNDADVLRFTTSTPFEFSQRTEDFYGQPFVGGAGPILNRDGTKLILIEDQGDSIRQYDLSTPFDLSSKSLVNTNTKPYNRGHGCVFGDNLDRLLLTNEGGNEVREFSLNGKMDISNLTVVTTHTMSDTVSWGCWFNDDGTKWYTGNRGDNQVNQFTLSSPFDLSSETNRESISDGENDLSSAIVTGQEGKKLYTFHHSPNHIFEFDLTTPWDVTTATNKSQIASSDEYDQDVGQHSHPPPWY